jgi:hypothetical protein
LGTRLLATLRYGVIDSSSRYGRQLMCEGGGIANATLVENLHTEAGA